jgi:hypothetical protein
MTAARSHQMNSKLREFTHAVAPIIAIMLFASGALEAATPKMSILKLGGNGIAGSDSWMTLDGVKYSDQAALKAAVAKLPTGRRLEWFSGCIQYSDLPLGPEPRIDIEEFTKFCEAHRVHFTYHCGMPVDHWGNHRGSFEIEAALRCAPKASGPDMKSQFSCFCS